MEELGIQSPPDQDTSDDIENYYTMETGNSDASSSDIWNSSDDSLPNRSFPARLCPATSLPYECSNCRIRYASQEMLVAHVLEDDGGYFSCSRHYQQWKQDRQHHRKEKGVLLIKSMFQRFPGLGVWQTTTNVNDGDAIENHCKTETINSDVSSSDTWNSPDISLSTETGNSADSSSDTWHSSDDSLPMMPFLAMQCPRISLFPKSPSLGIWQNTTQVGDDNFQDQMDRCRMKKRKNESENGCIPTKRSFI